MSLVSKPEILGQHLDAAIYLVALDNAYISAHTIIMVCEELFRTWLTKNDIYYPCDHRIYIRDEYQRQWINKIREKYNFFKHADRDIDATIDICPEELHTINEMMLAMTIHGYRYIFSETSKAADTYSRWFAAFYHDCIRWDDMPNGIEIKTMIENNKDILAFDPPSKRTLLRAMLYQTGAMPRIDTLILKALPTKVLAIIGLPKPPEIRPWGCRW